RQQIGNTLTGFAASILESSKYNNFRDGLSKEVDKISSLEMTLKTSIVEYVKSLDKNLKDIEDRVTTRFMDATAAIAELAQTLDKIRGKVDQAAVAVVREVQGVVDLARGAAAKLEDDLTDEPRRALQDLSSTILGNATKILAPYEKKLTDQIRQLDLG